MTATQTRVAPSRAAVPAEGRLKPDAIGLVGVVFMVVAFSAPITAMTGNVPVAVGYGNGTGAPAGFIVATVVLTIFSVGFTALARHITAAGAFYTFVSRGLGRPVGLAAGVLSMISYMAMEAGLVGIFAAFSQSAFASQFGVDLPWVVYALAAVVVMSLLSYRDVGLAAKVLALVLIGELALLSVMAFAVLFAGGGPDGLMLESINPLNAFRTSGLVEGSVGVGLLFAFWSWVGFESTAIYGEESRDPKKIVPRATMIAVIGIGVFYSFISWMMVAGNGAEQAVALATGEDPFELIYHPMRTFAGEWGVVAMEWFVLGGSFACALAIHNSATRYLYAFGRDGILWQRLGRSHVRHQSPHVASVTQSIFAAGLVVVSFAADVDPYGELFVLVAIMATVSLLSAQTLTSAAVVNYFHIQRRHPETATWWRTLVAPVVGGAGMAYVVYLLLSNMDTAAGAASQTLFGRMLPWVVATLFATAVATALFWRRTRPEVYSRIGSTVFAEAAPAAEVRSPSVVGAPTSSGVFVGVDPQAHSTGPLDWAARMAATTGQSLTVLHVAGDTAGSRQVLRRGLDFAEAAAPQVRADARLVAGNPSSVLVTESVRAGLLVVGTRGMPEFVGALLGSVAHTVSARAHCPVAVVRAEAAPLPGPGKPVVVGVDGAQRSAGALRFAAELASTFSAPLLVVGVASAGAAEQIGVAYRSSLIPGRGVAGTELAVEQAHATAARAAEEARALFPALEVRAETPVGDPGPVLAEYTASSAAVVIGAGDRTGMAELLLGSVSHDVIHRAIGTVVVVRS